MRLAGKSETEMESQAVILEPMPDHALFVQLPCTASLWAPQQTLSMSLMVTVVMVVIGKRQMADENVPKYQGVGVTS